LVLVLFTRHVGT